MKKETEPKKLSKNEAVKLFYDIVLRGKGAVSTQIAYENNKIARIKTRETVPIQTLHLNGIDPVNLNRR